MSPLSLDRDPGIREGEAPFTVTGRTVSPAAFWGTPTLPLAPWAVCVHSMKSGGYARMQEPPRPSWLNSTKLTYSLGIDTGRPRAHPASSFRRGLAGGATQVITGCPAAGGRGGGRSMERGVNVSLVLLTVFTQKKHLHSLTHLHSPFIHQTLNWATSHFKETGNHIPNPPKGGSRKSVTSPNDFHTCSLTLPAAGGQSLRRLLSSLRGEDSLRDGSCPVRSLTRGCGRPRSRTPSCHDQ